MTAPRTAVSARISKYRIEIDGEPIPFHIGQDVTVTPDGPFNRINVDIIVAGPVVCEGDQLHGNQEDHS